MENYILIISIIASLLIGLKLRSRCCGKECTLSIEKQQDNDDVLKSIRITQKSKVKTSDKNDTQTLDKNATKIPDKTTTNSAGQL